MEIMVRKLKVKEIKNPPKRWWPGESRVEPYMKDIDKALDRSGLTGQPRIDVYNRAYEAVHKAICDCENK